MRPRSNSSSDSDIADRPNFLNKEMEKVRIQQIFEKRKEQFLSSNVGRKLKSKVESEVMLSRKQQQLGTVMRRKGGGVRRVIKTLSKYKEFEDVIEEFIEKEDKYTMRLNKLEIDKLEGVKKLFPKELAQKILRFYAEQAKKNETPPKRRLRGRTNFETNTSLEKRRETMGYLSNDNVQTNLRATSPNDHSTSVFLTENTAKKHGDNKKGVAHQEPKNAESPQPKLPNRFLVNRSIPTKTVISEHMSHSNNRSMLSPGPEYGDVQSPQNRTRNALLSPFARAARYGGAMKGPAFDYNSFKDKIEEYCGMFDEWKEVNGSMKNLPSLKVLATLHSPQRKGIDKRSGTAKDENSPDGKQSGLFSRIIERTRKKFASPLMRSRKRNQLLFEEDFRQRAMTPDNKGIDINIVMHSEKEAANRQIRDFESRNWKHPLTSTEFFKTRLKPEHSPDLYQDVKTIGNILQTCNKMGGNIKAVRHKMEKAADGQKGRFSKLHSKLEVIKESNFLSEELILI